MKPRIKNIEDTLFKQRNGHSQLSSLQSVSFGNGAATFDNCLTMIKRGVKQSQSCGLIYTKSSWWFEFLDLFLPFDNERWLKGISARADYYEFVAHPNNCFSKIVDGQFLMICFPPYLSEMSLFNYFAFLDEDEFRALEKKKFEIKELRRFAVDSTNKFSDSDSQGRLVSNHQIVYPLMLAAIVVPTCVKLLC